MSPRKERMKLFTLRVELLETCIPIWRVVTVPDFYSLRDVYRIFNEAFGWDEDYEFRFGIKNDIYCGNPEEGIIRKLHHLEFQPGPDSKIIIDSLGDLLGYSKKFRMSLESNDPWIVQVTVLKKVSVDLDLFNFECLEGEGACPSSFFPGAYEFNKIYCLSHDPEVDPETKQDVDEYIKDNELDINGSWPGEFNLDEANRRLNNLKETIKNELDEFNGKYSEMVEQLGSGYLDDVFTSECEEGEFEMVDEPEMNILISSVVNLCKSNNISCKGIDLDNQYFTSDDFKAIIQILEQNSDPEIRAKASELKEAYDEFILIWHLQQIFGQVDLPTKTTKKQEKNSSKKKRKK
ncbi:MAG: hypothetical protein IJQ39_08290 [Thermoguttaceae bacterium]|nr:hypothetical protein [Thermoguttaceae bacterium]